MEINEFKKVLAKSLYIVDKSIKKGYLDENRREELTNKIILMIKKGVVYDFPGTAIYAMYSPREQRLYFNTKVFKSEEEALVYILHEEKHGLDHDNNSFGFKHDDKGVGSDEGATQRFATDMAEEILGIKFPRKAISSLGIQVNSNLDEYQLEDKLNELFCLTMGISMKEFIRMQNDPTKEKFKILLDKFNQHASYDIFESSLDEIYKIQEENWIDEDGNLLDEEKVTTVEQTKRAMLAIGRCRQELLKYAKKENKAVIEKIKEESFVPVNEYSEDISIVESYLSLNDIMDDSAICNQAEYINYQQNILNQIGSSYFDNECSVIFVTEFKYEYDKLDKIIYFRKGDSYQKMIIPVQDDMTLDIARVRFEKIEDITEIKEALVDCEMEFEVIANAPEYARILNITGEGKKAQNVLNKWNYYLSKQDQLEQIIQRCEESSKKSLKEIEAFESFDFCIELPDYPEVINYRNIFMSIDGITVIDPKDNSVKYVFSSDEEQQYISQIQSAVENGELILNSVQLNILKSYVSDNFENKK